MYTFFYYIQTLPNINKKNCALVAWLYTNKFTLLFERYIAFKLEKVIITINILLQFVLST